MGNIQRTPPCSHPGAQAASQTTGKGIGVKSIGLALAIMAMTLSGSLSNGQSKSTLRDWTVLSKKIEVGMSVNEVKRILGRPETVSGGFPHCSEEEILDDMPEQVGQMSSSTWFYKGKGASAAFYGDRIVRDTLDRNEDPAVYLRYLRSDLPDPSSRKSSAPEINYEKERIRSFHVKPVFCVIFDKGTQVVSGTKTFYLSAQ